MKRLIIDSGSTKTEWAVIDGKELTSQGKTDGFNPNYSNKNCYSSNALDEIIQKIDIKEISNVNFYGSGCGSEQNCNLVKDLIKQFFSDAEISVSSDMLAACHALFGSKSGVACILGTGSNACCYDGEKITKNAVSLGYLIGDEGSGNHIGKILTRDYFYGIMSENLRVKFEEKYHLNKNTFINSIYHQEKPSKYLASFALFADENQDDIYIENVCNQCFSSFIENHVLNLDILKNQEIAFVGSIAYRFKDILRNCLNSYNLKIGEIIAKPMAGLIEYYKVK